MVATEESVARDCITILFLCLFFSSISQDRIFPEFPFSACVELFFSLLLFIPLSLFLFLSDSHSHLSRPDWSLPMQNISFFFTAISCAQI